MAFRYTPLRHWLLLVPLFTALVALIAAVNFGFDDASLAIGIACGWGIGIAQGVNERIIYDAREIQRKLLAKEAE